MSRHTASQRLTTSLARLDEIIGQAKLRQGIGRLHRSIFNARGPGEWNLQWTAAQAQKQIFENRRPLRRRTYVALWRSGRRLVGLATAMIIRPEEFPATELPPQFRDMASLHFVRCDLASAFGAKTKIAYVSDFGVLKSFRRGNSVALLYEMLVRAKASGARHACAWTLADADKRALPRLLSVGVKVFFTMNGGRLVFGGLDIDTFLKNLSAAT